MLRIDMQASFYIIPQLVQGSFYLLSQHLTLYRCIPTTAKVSIERIADFLRNVSTRWYHLPTFILTSSQTELIDEFDEEKSTESVEIQSNAVPEDKKDVIGIRNARFTWSKESAPSQTPGGTRKRAFVLSVDDELALRRGKINLIIGPTGAGKTSLLMALLGMSRPGCMYKCVRR